MEYTADIGTRNAVDQALSRLARRNTIRRLVPGAVRLSAAQYHYLSSGPNAAYDILGTKLVFAHRKQQRTSLDYAFAATLVQALHALGKDEISDDQRERLASLRSPRDYDRVLRWTKSTTAWVHEEIRRIAEKAQEQGP